MSVPRSVPTQLGAPQGSTTMTNVPGILFLAWPGMEQLSDGDNICLTE